MKTVITLLSSVVLLYLFLALAMYLFQRKLIYHPAPAIEHTYNERQIVVDTNVTLRVIEANPDKSEAVIYFSGNGGLSADSVSNLAAALPEKTLYLVNYRGYGGSDGSPTEAHLFNDAEKVFEAIAAINDAQHQHISVIGRSLGSGVASYLASRKPIRRLVLISPYDSILKVAQSTYPMFPVRWLLKDRFESDKYAPLIKAPVLVLLAENDAVIPLKSSQRLLQYLPESTQSYTFSNKGHNDLRTHRDFYPTIVEFLNSSTAGPN